jgi:formate dehydrogenase subunit gamma
VSAYECWNVERANALIAEHAGLQGPLLPILHAFVKVFGYIDDHVLKLCRAEACQAAGGEAVAARAEQRLGIALGETSADGRISLEPVYCLGLCACAPSAIFDGRVHGRLDEKRIDAIVAEAQR